MTAPEQSIVRFGRTSISYSIERGRRRRTVAIAVDPERGVRVRAPTDTSVAKLDELVRRKSKWVIDRSRKIEDLPPRPLPREFVSGETFLYAGKQYRLKLVNSVSPERVGLVGGKLQVNTRENVRSSLIDWYRQRAQERLDARVSTWAERVGVRPSAVLVREQRTRWGSADRKGNLRFNWRIVQASTRLLDYVVAHELVHLVYKDHGREFWAMLGRAMPDYELRREKLRTAGRAMIW